MVAGQSLQILLDQALMSWPIAVEQIILNQGEVPKNFPAVSKLKPVNRRGQLPLEFNPLGFVDVEP
ncbi:MAG: hypothetical protein KME35_22920 [Aphanocapsa sp. GSE-SYN-MK-11-07L]|nr:hypothetical protein [Aphanocapsa sp. GSE-SYN-MK-11-07L]